MKYRLNFYLLACLFVIAISPALDAQQPYWTSDPTFSPAIEGDPGVGGSNSLYAYPGGKLLVDTSYAMIDGQKISGRVMRLNSDGTLDSSFHGPTGALPLLSYPDGTTLVATSPDSYAPYRIQRLLSDGSFDPSFSGPMLNPSGAYALGAVWLADGRTLLYGDFTTVSGSPQIGLVVLGTNGSVDNAFTSPLTPNSSDHTVGYVAQTVSGRILISGRFYASGASALQKLVQLTLAGATDATFDASGVVFSSVPTRLYPQSDGKVLVVDGANNLIRLTSTGASDVTFTLGLVGSPVDIGVRQSDGKIFYLTSTSVNFVYSTQLRRMNPDGSDDPSFPAISTPYSSSSPLELPVLSDDGTYFEGALTAERNAKRWKISHVLADGSIDPVYHPRFSRDALIAAYARQLDGKHLIAGAFDYINGDPVPQAFDAVRMNIDGTIDSSFSFVPSAAVSHLSLQPDGKIIVEGNFPDGSGGYNRVIRLNVDGSIDATFFPITQDYISLVIDRAGYIYVSTTDSARVRRYAPDGQPDNSFQVGTTDSISLITPLDDGSLLTVASAGLNAIRLRRFLHNGTQDLSFPGQINSNGVLALASLPDGNALICERFNLLNAYYLSLSRIRPDGTRDYVYNTTRNSSTAVLSVTQLAVAGAVFDLLRASTGGTASQISLQFALDRSTLNCGADGQLFIQDSQYYGTFFQKFQRTVLASPSVDAAPTVLRFLPLNPVVQPGALYFSPSATVSGVGPFTYQWLKNGDPIPGKTSQFIIIQSAQVSDSGGYSVIVSGAFGSVTTASDILTVGNPPATVVTHPSSQTVVVGGSAILVATAIGTPAPTYQWKKNGVEISGARSATLALTNIQTSDAGLYTLVATNPGGSATSKAATLTVNPAPAAPVITTQPLSKTATVGSTVMFLTSASGTPAPTFQWQKNGLPINGATGATYTIGSAATGDAGDYTVVAINSVASATSNPATLTVNPVSVAPVITTQPLSGISFVGSSVVLTVEASGTPTPTFQWMKNGVAINGAIGATLMIVKVVAGDAGSYTAVATNSAGSVTSDAAVITIDPIAAAPVITTQPSSLTVGSGFAAVFSVTVTGFPLPTFQWQKNGVNIAGTNSGVYTIANVTLADAGSYTVVASNSIGSVESIPAILTVNSTLAPNITTQPLSSTVFAGGSVTFTSAASGSPTPTYQWRKNGINIPGAVESAYTIPSAVAADAGGYAVVVTNPAGSVTSQTATLTVQSLPGDFNGDGKVDVLWQNKTTGQRSVWYLNGTTLLSGVNLWTVDPAWEIAAVVDLNEDGKSDLLWQNKTTGQRSVWYLDGTTVLSGVNLWTVDPAWEIAAAVDLNGDGKADILWQNKTTGQRSVWYLNGTTLLGGDNLWTVDPAWDIADVVDLNGDGNADVLWQNKITGQRSVWYLNGTTLLSGVNLWTVDPAWDIVP